MKPIEEFKNKIIQGDCLEVLKTLPDNSVDSIVTDPPAGISFMGKDWDNKGTLIGFQNFICEVFTEAIRVLKPGGHALVWALPRTSHHTAMGLERAGLEIRDCVYHIFGSGFPKSLNIALAIDKQKKAIGHRGSAINVSGKGERKDIETSVSKSNGKLKEGYNNAITAEGKKWQGWGTALKPAVECWWLCRKPISEKTVAENVLKWGTGGINIDGSRVGTEVINIHNAPKGTFAGGEPDRGSDTDSYRDSIGRFPANFIHDGSDEVVRLFPNSETHAMSKGKNKFGGVFGNDKEVYNPNLISSSGSAARFFYAAKPSKAERNMGCEELPEKLAAGLPLLAKGGERGGEAEDGSSTDRIVKQRNFHPTVKALSLMTYLIKLITPPRGIVLDMFAGSGSTLIAAKKLGHPFIGIEKEADYIKIAQARVDAVQEGLF